MRDARFAPALIAAALSLSISACSKPDVVSRVQTPAPPRGEPVQTEQVAMGAAEKVQRLNIMLMVTALRCRGTSDDFTSEYRHFTAEQTDELNQAGAQLRSQLVARHGAPAGKVAFDRLSTVMANGYGQGHPWLSCRQLKQVAHDLAEVQGGSTLVEAADQLLARHGPSRVAAIGR